MAVIVQGRTPPVTVALIGLTLALSVVVAIDARLGGQLYHHLALVPEAVWRGQLWRLATWPFIHGGPLSLIFTCVTIYVFGSDLLFAWGARRYLGYLAAIALVAGVGTSLIALVMPGASDLPYLCGLVVTDALVIAWARRFPEQPVLIYFVLQLRGRELVSVVIAITLIFAAFLGVAWMMPELLAVAAALVIVNRSVRRWWLERKLAWTRRRLRVVRGGGADVRDEP